MSEANRKNPKHNYIHAVILSAVLLLVGTLAILLAQKYVPIGEGPDEISHIDYTRFVLNHRVSEIDVRAGLSSPGKAPLGQGHQPPLSYLIGAGLLSVFYDTTPLGKLVDYSAGITYSSSGRLFGGKNACSYGIDVSRDDSTTFSARSMLTFLRTWNVVLLLVSILLTYTAGRLLFSPSVGLVASLVHAAIPTAIYRSIFVSNDNLAATLSSLAFVIACVLGTRKESRSSTLLSLSVGVVCGLAFLAKYSGVVTLVFCPLLLLSCLSLSWSTWLRRNMLVALAFGLTVSRDLYLNLTIDGDVLSSGVLREVVPFLYRPSSFFTVLSDPNFLATVYERFWVNFHVLGPGIGDGILPVWILPSWYALSIGATIGLSLNIWRKAQGRRVLALTMILIVMLGLIVAFATKYPLPAGRYLHVVVTPICILVAVCLLALSCSKRFVSGVTVASLILVLANSTFSFVRLKGEFQQCKSDLHPTVDGGIEARLGDLNGDGVNEVFLFHRIRNRLFIAQNNDGEFTIKPDWTRLVGLVADEFEVADVNGDGLDDPVFRRVGASLWNTVDARSIVDGNPARKIAFLSRFTVDSQALVADFNVDGKADLGLYFPAEGRWKTYDSIELEGRFRRNPRPSLSVAPKGLYAVLFLRPIRSKVAFYDQESKQLLLTDSQNQFKLTDQVSLNLDRILRVPQNQRVMSAAWSENSLLCYIPMRIEDDVAISRKCIQMPLGEEDLIDHELLLDGVENSSVNIIMFNRRHLTLKKISVPFTSN